MFLIVVLKLILQIVEKTRKFRWPKGSSLKLTFDILKLMMKFLIVVFSEHFWRGL